MAARQTRSKTAQAEAAAVADANIAASEVAGSTENIFMFYPNLIGYFRIVLAVASLYYMPLHPRTCCLLYSISCLLDALDGYAARYFDQSTRFGAVLDMVTDRCTTTCLLVFLSMAFPRWAIIFQILISLDLASHYMHMYATMAVGGSNKSHKAIERGGWLLKLYYHNKLLQTEVAAVNDLDITSQVNNSILRQIFPDPYSAAALEVARANKMDSTIPWIVAGISLPIMALKQWLNIVQLVVASQDLAALDVAARSARGLPKKKN
ncbi:hypothetical protein HOO65_010601 [Ceratocystis lukuohia]|uniref:CDP-diacylglycerol--inositol 3-phosphatidyltransferase n=1 Tax=Ceratocystis lukuohia TaxID=2019550 RepID=A0ABR4MSJ9_9PEZI